MINMSYLLVIPISRLENDHSLIKRIDKIYFLKGRFQISIYRNTKTPFTNMESTDKGFRNSGTSGSIQNIFS